MTDRTRPREACASKNVVKIVANEPKETYLLFVIFMRLCVVCKNIRGEYSKYYNVGATATILIPSVTLVPVKLPHFKQNYSNISQGFTIFKQNSQDLSLTLLE